MARIQESDKLQRGRSLPRRYNSYVPDEHEFPIVTEETPRSGLRAILGGALLSILALVIIGVGVLAAWDARNISSASQKMFGSGNIFSLLFSDGLQTDSSGRVNLLVAGYSADDPGHAGADLTDSIMLISMDPINKTGYMLSIPRDLYVNLGSLNCKSRTNHCKINEAYEDGGMSFLARTVETVTGLKIPYYALVNYSAVRGIVDAVGGIDVTINSPDGRLYDPNVDYTTGGTLVDLTNGNHHLNGQQALDLTRARGDSLTTTPSSPIGFEQSDFQRTADQRLVFSAIKSKLNWKLILNPRKNSQILNVAADNVKTNIPVSEVRPLFGLFNSIPNSKLRSLSLKDLNGKNYIEGTYYQGSTQTPTAGLDDYSQIQTALSQLSD